MTEQLTLIDVAAIPSLTPRQQRALDIVREHGRSGIHADELGAILHAEYKKHRADERCKWCGAAGQDLLKALRAKGLVRYRRRSQDMPGYWQAADLPRDPAADVKPGAMPYNEFPAGY